MTPIRIRALRHSAFYSPLLLTISGGFLEEEGLMPQYDVATPASTVEGGLLSGEIQVAQSAVAAGFAALDGSAPSDIRHFAQINERDGFFLTRRGQETGFDWGELAGKTVLVDHLFQPLAMLKFAMHVLGHDFNGMSVVDAGDVEAMDKAFRAGQGDYIHQQGPYGQQLEADGIGRVVASVGEVIGPVAFSSLCATQEWLGSDMAHGFMRAYRRGQAAALDLTPAEIAPQLTNYFPHIREEVLRETVAAYQALGCWTRQARISEASYARTLDVFEFSGGIRQRHAYELLVAPPPDEA